MQQRMNSVPSFPFSRRFARRGRGKAAEEGFALLLVLWALLLLSVLGGSFLVEARTTRIVADTGVTQLRARLMSDGAINRAIMALLDMRDPLRLPLDGSTRVIRLFDRDIRLRVESENGKASLNAAPLGLLAALFRSIDVPSEDADALAARVVAWRTPSSDNARSDETALYRQAGRSYRPRFGPFRSVGELRLVLGMTDVLQAAIAPLTTVWSGDSAIDRSVAGDAMLRVLEGAGDSLARAQRVARDAGKAAGAGRALAVGEAVTIAARLEMPDMIVERTAVIQLAGDRREPYRVLAWH
jgi:general secretion pathway protein K